MRRASRTAGMSLIEIMVALAILIIIVAAIYLVLAGTSRSYAGNVRLANIQEQARRVVDELAEELRVADEASLLISTVNGAHQAEFRKNTGFVGGAAVWSGTITWRFESSEVDANENGVADEGRIVRIEGAETRTLSHYIKTGGVTLTRTGNNVVIRLTLVNADAQGKVIETFVESSVTMRNSSS